MARGALTTRSPPPAAVVWNARENAAPLVPCHRTAHRRRRGGREGLVDMMRKYPNWFSPNRYQFAAQVDRLPFDQHWLIALAAPRALISLEGTDDQNCVSNALKQAIAGAAPAYRLLGA